MYAKYPVLIVKDWSKLNQATLEGHYKRLSLMAKASMPLLHRSAWHSIFEAQRTTALVKIGVSSNATRMRCWG